MKKHHVYTFYYPEDNLFLAYLTYQGPSPDSRNDREYDIEAPSGYEAKKIALRLRREEVKDQQRKEQSK